MKSLKAFKLHVLLCADDSERSHRCACVSERSCHGYHLVVEIGSVEGGGERDWLWHTKNLLTVLKDTAGCRGSEAEQGHFRELPLQDSQQLIIYTVPNRKFEFDLEGDQLGCLHSHHRDLSPGLKSCPH